MTADAASAAALSQRLRDLPLVLNVLSINSFVPADQAPKLALIADARNLLGATLAPRPASARPNPEQIRTAAKVALGRIEPSLSGLSGEPLIPALADDLRGLAIAPDSILLALGQTLTRFLPTQLDRLRDALEAQPVTLQTIPPELARDWLLPDGRARIHRLDESGKGKTMRWPDLERADPREFRRYADRLEFGTATRPGGRDRPAWQSPAIHWQRSCGPLLAPRSRLRRP
jgi:hypothetical protein